MVIAEGDLVVTPDTSVALPSEVEVRAAFEQLRVELESLAHHGDHPDGRVMLLSPDGDASLAIPASVFEILRFVVHHMSRGDAISLMPLRMRLTTQEAADLIGVSRPFFVKLLEEGVMPFTKTGRHRRVELRHVLEYKERRDREALEALAVLAREAQDAGDYFGQPG